MTKQSQKQKIQERVKLLEPDSSRMLTLQKALGRNEADKLDARGNRQTVEVMELRMWSQGLGGKQVMEGGKGQLGVEQCDKEW